MNGWLDGYYWWESQKHKKTHKLNQVEFSNAIQISQGRLSEIEIGKCNPSAETLISIARSFDIDLNWLLLGENKNLKPISDSQNQFLELLDQLPVSSQKELLEVGRNFHISLLDQDNGSSVIRQSSWNLTFRWTLIN